MVLLVQEERCAEETVGTDQVDHVPTEPALASFLSDRSGIDHTDGTFDVLGVQFS